MDRPQHLPITFFEMYLMMELRGVLSDRQKNFFLDAKMATFWKKSHDFLNDAKQYLGGYYEPSSVAGTLVGIFLSPLEFYGQSGTVHSPSPSGAVAKNQKEVDELLRYALVHTNELLEIFNKVPDISPYYPEEIDAITVGGVEVSPTNLLLKISHALAEYPEAEFLFESMPGLTKSRKDTWLDWYHQVNENLQSMKRTHGCDFRLTVDDWAKIYIVLFAPELDVQTAKERIKGSIKPKRKIVTSNKLKQGGVR